MLRSRNRFSLISLSTPPRTTSRLSHQQQQLDHLQDHELPNLNRSNSAPEECDCQSCPPPRQRTATDICIPLSDPRRTTPKTLPPLHPQLSYMQRHHRSHNHPPLPQGGVSVQSQTTTTTPATTSSPPQSMTNCHPRHDR